MKNIIFIEVHLAVLIQSDISQANYIFRNFRIRVHKFHFNFKPCVEKYL